MKKINISVSLKLVGMTGPILSVPAEVANAVYSQLLAHKDIHYSYEDSGTWKEVIIPYLAIVYAQLDSTSSSVDAPTDDFCDEASPEENPLSLVLQTSLGNCYTVNDDQVCFVTTYEDDGGEWRAAQCENGELVDTFIKEVIFNGEAIDFYDAWDAGTFDAQAVVTLENGVATLTATATYEGYTSTVVYTADTVCQPIGG